MPPLTKRLRAACDSIRAYTNRHRFPPTIREIGKHLEIKSPNGIQCPILALEKRGVISRQPGLARSLVVTM